MSTAQRASAIAETRYRNGLVSQLELLDARRNELQNRRLAQRVEATQRQATVLLIRALGGGWEVKEDAGPVKAVVSTATETATLAGL